MSPAIRRKYSPKWPASESISRRVRITADGHRTLVAGLRAVQPRLRRAAMPPIFQYFSSRPMLHALAAAAIRVVIV